MSKPISILVTGSAGRVGQAACQGLSARGHCVRRFDLREPGDTLDSIPGDITRRDEVERAMAGIEVVVHLAATPDEDDFIAKLVPNNIIGLYNVLESARCNGVRRVILASTGQVVMGHEGPWPITPEMPYSPRNWYAATKVMAEAAGKVYAYAHGLSIIVVRLGWCPRDKEHAAQLAADEFGKDVYLSPRDAARFFLCAVEAPYEIQYRVLFATSKPLRRTRYDITTTRTLLGCEPHDTWPEGTEIVES